MDSRGVDTVPSDLAVHVGVVGVDGVAAEQESGSVNQAVAAFPLDGVDVVGYVHLPVDERRQRVVEGTAGVVLEIHHGHAVLVAIVEADGAAVAIPEGVAGTHNETDAVVAEVEAGQGAEHLGGVLLFLHAHPGFGMAFLDAVHQVEEHAAEAADGVHGGGVGTISVHGHPSVGGAIAVVFGHASDDGVGHIIATAQVSVGHVGVAGGDHDGLHLFPFAGEPYAVFGEGFGVAVVGFGGCCFAQREVGLGGLEGDVAFLFQVAPFLHHLAVMADLLCHAGKGHGKSHEAEKDFFH